MTAYFLSCLAKSCGDPGSPENGKKKSLLFTFKSKVYFECNYGYKLVGDKYRQCQSNQKWSGQKPTCERKHILITFIFRILSNTHVKKCHAYTCFSLARLSQSIWLPNSSKGEAGNLFGDTTCSFLKQEFPLDIFFFHITADVKIYKRAW